METYAIYAIENVSGRGDFWTFWRGEGEIDVEMGTSVTIEGLEDLAKSVFFLKHVIPNGAEIETILEGKGPRYPASSKEIKKFERCYRAAQGL